MAAGDPIASLSDLILLATGGGSGSPEQINFFKKALVAGAAPGTLVAGRITSLWQYDGQPSGATTTPTTAVTCSNSTAGSWQQTTSASGAKKRLLSVVAAALNVGSLIIYDRLVHHGGFSATTTGAQTTNNASPPALTRRTTGVGVEAWLEIYTQIGTTGTTITASYTNSASTSGRTTQAATFGNTGFREAQRILPLPLASGDKGVQVLASVNAAASTLTAGNFGYTLAYPLVTLQMPLAGAGQLWSGIASAGGPLDLGATSDACLALAWFPNSTTAPEIFGQAFFVEK